MTLRMFKPIPPLSTRFVSGLAIAIVAVISVLDLVGWMLDLPLLKSINPQWAPMPVITAFCFLISAAALVCAQDRTSMRRLVVARILGVVVGAAGLLTVASYLAELQTGQEWVWARYSWMCLSEPHRMAVIGAIIFTLFGGVLLLLGSGRRRAADIGHALLLPAAILTYLVLVGYLLNIRIFYEWLHRGIALNTGLAFGALCIAAFYVRPDTWLMAVFTGADAGAIMARRLLPGLLFLPLLIAWLRVTGERTGLFVSEVGVALVAMTYAVCFLALVWWSARSVGQSERLRRRVEAMVRENEERLNHALDAGEFGTWSLDTKTGRAWRSLRHDQIFGYASLLPEWTYDIFLRHVLEEDRQEVDAKFGRALAAGQDWNFECRIRRTDGAVRWLWVQGKPKWNERNEVAQFIGLVKDVTERQQMENELRQSHDALESRVREQTAALAHTVETLRKEIDQRRRAERQVRSASIYTRSLIEASLDPLVTISPEGRITDVNRATEEATGVPRDRLIGADFSDYFVEPEKAREGYRKVLAEGTVRDYALTLRHVSGRLTDVLYNASVYRNEAGAVQGVFAAARDITERQAAERRQNVINRLLELFAQKNSRKEYLSAAAETVREWSGCRCLGIRVANADGTIPYEVCLGFGPEFEQRESRLSTATDACFCIRAITQNPDPADRRVLTPNGSFCCEDTRAFAAALTPETRGRYRGECLRRGFNSLAIVPIRYRDQVVGAIHLADERAGRVAPGLVEFVEHLSPMIGEAIHRFDAEAELERHRQHLEVLVQQRTAELEQTNRRLQEEIAVRTQAEDAAQRVAEELTRSNQDLEQFAYVASHDLQEPLRAVAGFMSLLRRQYRDRLDAKAQGYIDQANEGAERMQTLINNLLDYSRVGTRGDVFKPVRLDAALDAALDNLRAAVAESGAIITRDPLPTIKADSTQLAQLLQNLIGNAIKFRSSRRPEIHVGACRAGAPASGPRDPSGNQPGARVENQRPFQAPTDLPPGWLIFVRDNGIGIESAYYDRIFLIFQRLHVRTQYPGTGIGLAVCKKIVERHGGRIWVESQAGEGTTFYFNLPDQGAV